MKSASHAPHSTRPRGAPSQNARTSAVLPMPGLAGDEHEPPAALGADRRQVPGERLELLGALEEPLGAGGRTVGHRHMFAPATRALRDQPRRQKVSPIPMASHPATTYGKAS